MQKQAIIVTVDNVSGIADTLVDLSAQDILDETLRFLNQGKTVVLVKHILEPKVAVVSHIVLESMFYANMKTDCPLNTFAFVEAVPV